MPSLLSGAAPILWEEFNLERKWRISSDLKQRLVCDLFLLCPRRRGQRGPSCCAAGRAASSAAPALTYCPSGSELAAGGQDQEDRKLLLVKDKKSPRPLLHYPGADPNSPQGEGADSLFTQILGMSVQKTDLYSSSLNVFWVISFSQSQRVEPNIPVEGGKKSRERGTLWLLSSQRQSG